MACASIVGDGVASRWAGAVKTSWGVGAAVGAHVTSSWQSAFIYVYGQKRIKVSVAVCGE